MATGRKKTRIVRFELAKLFPPSNPIAVDIIRLMGGCNDIYQLMSWLKTSNAQKLSEDPGSHSVEIGRFWLQTRLLISCFHESLKVIRQMTKRPDFSTIRPLLEAAAERDLRELENFQISGLSYKSSDWDLDEAIVRTRHRTTFHYDSAQIKHTLESWQTKYPNQMGDIVIDDEAGDRWPPYYAIVEIIRTDIAFGIRNPRHDENSERLFKALGSLNRFVESLFFAYVDYNGLGHVLRRVVSNPNVD